MVATDKLFAGSIPEIYDRYLVPLIFEPYALDLAQRVATRQPRRILETAAGTGVLTRAMASRMPTGTEIVATDLNQPMVAHAAKLQAAGTVEWRQADALALPFEDDSFDTVVCQFGVMFFPDKVVGFREARRVLKPPGRFLFNVWDRISDNEFADVVTEAVADLFPHDPPRFLARTPHGHHDADRLRADLQTAGFTDISIDTVERVSKASSPLDPAIGFCQGTPLRNEIEARDAARLQEATNRAAQAVASRFGSGPIEGRLQAIVIDAGG
jgi:ubiquinone/menaquinone biosynthesis C-methylase UbiE